MSDLGLISVRTSQIMLRHRHDVTTGTSIDGPIWDIFSTSHWYINKTNQFGTSQQCTNWYLIETDQLNRWQRHHNWYLNKTNIFETLYIVGTPPLLKGGVNLFYNCYSWGAAFGKFLLDRGGYREKGGGVDLQ